jgi:ribonucleoside-diphosphate reductase alpha chain
VKTTYYLHMMPRHTAEQSTVKVNKAEQVRPAGDSPARRGFGARKAATSGSTVASAPALDLAEVVDGTACPTDPMERLQCDSCQ